MARPAALLVIVCALMTLALGGAVARAADPDAPAGAPANWLPNQPWVLDHWLPYDETRLFRILRVDRKQLLAWQRDESHTLADLARLRDVDPRMLPAQLVGPRGDRPRALYRLLVYRATK